MVSLKEEKAGRKMYVGGRGGEKNSDGASQ